MNHECKMSWSTSTLVYPRDLSLCRLVLHSSYDPHRHLRYLDGHAGTAADEQICQRSVGGTQVDRVGVGVGEWANRINSCPDLSFLRRMNIHLPAILMVTRGIQGYRVRLLTHSHIKAQKGKP